MIYKAKSSHHVTTLNKFDLSFFVSFPQKKEKHLLEKSNWPYTLDQLIAN